jgi:hypothetical protein
LAITSTVPGNLFVEGADVAFSIAATNAVHFACVDFWGKTVAAGDIVPVDSVASVDLKTLPPGWYELSCKDSVSGSGTRTSFGVVMDRHGAPLPANGRVCADAASAWLIHQESQRKPFASMVALSGIPCVRERLSWAATEPQNGVYDWSHYQPTVDTLSAAGVGISEIWHDSPDYTHPGSTTTKAPDNLLDMYTWAKTAASHFSSVASWQIWNEPDIGFWPDLGDRYAGLVKAAYWGIKDGNPAATVTLAGLADGPSHFTGDIYASGVSDYYDKFNWHTYRSTDDYAKQLEAHVRDQSSSGATVRPAWLTEAGIRLPNYNEADANGLSPADRTTQALFTTESVVESLAAGDERHFFFVLPDYIENGTQFGTLHPDLTPQPSFLALSAAANLIGVSNFVGVSRVGDLEINTFETSSGTVTVCWSNTQKTIDIPVVPGSTLFAADIFGARTPLVPENSVAQLEIGRDPVYLIEQNPHHAAILRSLVPPDPTNPQPSHLVFAMKRDLPVFRFQINSAVPSPSRIVLAGHADDPVDKALDAYRLQKGAKSVAYNVDVYNFDPKRTIKGAVAVFPPTGWTCDTRSVPCTLGPMTTQAVTFNLALSSASVGLQRVSVRGNFAKEHVAPAVSMFVADASDLTPIRAEPITLLPASNWDHNVARIGDVNVTEIANGLHVAATFKGEGDRWAYPTFKFPAGLNLSKYDGIAFDLTSLNEPASSWIRMILQEGNGPTYIAGTNEFGPTRHVVLLFNSFTWLGGEKPDAETSFDPSNVSSMGIGLNTPADSMSFDITNVQAVKF